MNSFWHNACLQDFLPTPLVSFLEQRDSDHSVAPPAHPSEQTRPSHKQAQRLQETFKDHQNRLVLARWVFDLDTLDKERNDTAAEAGLEPRKRRAGTHEDQPPAKRGHSGNSPHEQTKAGQLHARRVESVGVVPGDGITQEISLRRLRPHPSEHGLFEFEVSTSDKTSLGEISFRANLTQAENALLNEALDLLPMTRTSRVKLVPNLSFHEGKNVRHLYLTLELRCPNAQSLDEALFSDSSTHRQAKAEAVLSKIYDSAIHHPNARANGFSPRLFYDAVHVPPHDSNASKEDIHVPGLETGLYPFQKRTLKWLLRREKQSEEEEKMPKDDTQRPSNGFVETEDANGQVCYFSPWLQLFTTHQALLRDPTSDLKGGILAEEMGLGKTVELISLIQLHKRSKLDIGTKNNLYKSAATLVVAPRPIIEQWKAEIETHAPSVAVVIYKGLQSSQKRQQLTDRELLENLTAHDVVLVPYEVLRSEIYFAVDPPQRSMRHQRKYERRRSPLTKIDWWRVILDEAQTIESGVSNAARVALEIPRQNAWAVSGTPLKKDSSDLLGLMTFLRLQPYSMSAPLFNRLITRETKVFTTLIGRICLRHSKEHVKGDLQLPPQKRVVINMPFTAIEEQHYSQVFEEMVNECGLDTKGAPIVDEWSPENAGTISLLRLTLARLRQICLHPEVGERNRRALGRGEGPLRTVDEVLSVMRDNNETALRSEERLQLQSMLKRGQILEHAKQPVEAKAIWLQVFAEAERLAQIDRRAMASEPAFSKNVTEIASEEDHEDDSSNPRLAPLKNRLRDSIELQHTATFFIANAIFQIKSDETLTQQDSDEYKALEAQETLRYEEAKMLRRELLASAAERVTVFMTKIKERSNDQGLVKIPSIKDLPLTGGVVTRKFVEQLEDLMDTLNQQAELLDEWRHQLVKAVLLPLVDQEDTELTGEEYEESTKEEDKIHAYMEAVRLLIADRTQSLTGQRNLNVRREAANLLRSARAGEGHAPELVKELIQQCDKIRLPELGEGDIEVCLRGLIAQFNHLRGSLETRAQRGSTRSTEIAIIDNILSTIKIENSNQNKTTAALEKELDLFSDAVNVRVEYYRQLQVISDLVAPFEEELSEVERATRLKRLEDNETSCKRRIANLRSRRTYLEKLKTESEIRDIDRQCVICQDSFDNGCLTTCGHVYCKECIQLWWAQHRTCPMCKASISKKDLHPITYKPITMSVQDDTQARNSDIVSPESTPSTEKPQSTIYSGINQETLDQIRNIDLKGSYGTKVDMLARHIIWLRESDPGAKSVVFSQFRDFLTVLEHAFNRFRIGWASMENGAEGVEKFKKDSAVECLFLHAKAQASGLNLINATHVFICEPLINTAIELQAIARVHRIGQHHATTVWMYLVENTVEKAIYDISVERRMSHIQRSPVQNKSQRRLKNGLTKQSTLEDEIDVANSIEIEDTPTAKLLTSGRSGGEQVAKEDLWPCLFKYTPVTRNRAAGEDAERAVTTFLAAEAAETRLNAGTSHA